MENQKIYDQLTKNINIQDGILMYYSRKIHIDLFYKFVDVVKQLIEKDLEYLIRYAAKECESLNFYYSMSKGPSIHEITQEIQTQLNQYNSVNKIRYFCDLFIQRFFNICDLTGEFRMYAETNEFIKQKSAKIGNELSEYRNFESQQINNR